MCKKLVFEILKFLREKLFISLSNYILLLYLFEALNWVFFASSYPAEFGFKVSFLLVLFRFLPTNSFSFHDHLLQGFMRANFLSV